MEQAKPFQIHVAKPGRSDVSTDVNAAAASRRGEPPARILLHEAEDLKRQLCKNSKLPKPFPPQCLSFSRHLLSELSQHFFTSFLA